MTVQQLNDPRMPIGDILQTMGPEGGLFESSGANYALLPLDDQLLDFLLERSPRFRQVCQNIRQRMQTGQFHTHEEARRLLSEQST